MSGLPRSLVLPLLVAAATMTASAAPPGTVPEAIDTPTGSFPAIVRAIVLVGQPAPTGGTFTELSDPALNNRGDLAFAAVTSTPHVNEAVYLRTGVRISALATTGGPAPSGGVFRGFNDVVLNDRGTVVFLGLTTDRMAQQGLFLARSGTVAPIVTSGQPSPSGGVFSDLANPTVNNQDVTAFVGRTGQAREGIFTGSEGSITAALLSGQAAPTGGVFEFFLDGTPALNDRGQIALVAATTDHSTQGVYVLTGGRAVPVVTTDDEAPVGGKFTEFGSVVITDAGTVAFIGRTAHSTVREALYVTGRVGLIPLAWQGQGASGDVLTTFANAVIDAGEDVIFQLGSPDPIPRAIYRATRAGVAPVLRAGDPAPGGGRFTAFSTPALNGRGEIAFVAEIDSGRHGIYLVSPR